MKEFSIIGSSPPRVDALGKVTGKAMYTADFKTAGMLHLKIVRSPHAHAKIVSIDTSKAELLSGVRGILKPEDVPDKRVGFPIADRYLLPHDNIVRFAGEAVAVIAADTADIAEEAVELVKIEYELLADVFDPERAMGVEAPTIIHPNRHNYAFESSLRFPEILDPDVNNLQNKAFLYTGDVEKGFQEADLIVEGRYVAETVQHCPIETHIIDAWVEGDGILTVRSSRQGYFSLRRDLSRFFDMPLSKIRVIGPYLGGGFGSKLAIYPEVLVSWVAMRIGKPVRLDYTRKEDLTTGGRREKMVTYFKHGVKGDGTLLAVEAKIIIDGGAYASDRTLVVPRSAMNGISATYRIPNVKVDSYGVYTNLPPCCPWRGVGVPSIVWGVEQQMDIIAEKLDMDPIELRKMNILNEGDVNPIGETTESIGMVECLDKVAGWIEWDKKPQKEDGWVKGKGVGIGPALCALGYPVTSLVKVCPDGMIKVFYGSAELGQGVHTVIAQIAAEEFKSPLSKINVVYGDTGITPLDWDNRGSRTTISTGNAVIRASQDAKRQIFELAAYKMGCAPQDLDISNGRIHLKDRPSNSIPIEDLFTPMGIIKGVGEIIGRGEFSAATPPIDPETGRCERLAIWGYGAYAVEVGVNLETGEVKIFRIAGAFDVGQPINLNMCEQQIGGGIGMGISTALYEELKFDDGSLLNPNLTDYKICTSMDIPSGESVATFIVKAPHKDGPYGAKGFGEVVVVGVAPAIGNALYNATGVRVCSTPMSGETVLAALKAAT